MSQSQQEGDAFDGEAVYSNRNDVSGSSDTQTAIDTAARQEIDGATRIAISRVSNIIRVFGAHFIPLTDTLLLEAYEWAVEQEGDVRDLLQEDVGDALVATVTAHN